MPLPKMGGKKIVVAEITCEELKKKKCYIYKIHGMKFISGWYNQGIHVEAKSIAIAVKNDCAGAVCSIIQGIHVA